MANNADPNPGVPPPSAERPASPPRSTVIAPSRSARISPPGAPAPAKRSNTLALAATAGLVLAVLIVGGLLVLNPFAAPACTNCGQVLEFAEVGHHHLKAGEQPSAYNSDPPTSGDHREEFPPNGPDKPLYEQPLSDQVTVHLMEHGFLVAWYNCKAGPDCDAIRDKLVQAANAIPRDAPYRMFVMPRPTMPNHATIALGAWQHLLFLDKYDDPQVSDFIKRFGAAVQENMAAKTPGTTPGATPATTPGLTPPAK